MHFASPRALWLAALWLAALLLPVPRSALAAVQAPSGAAGWFAVLDGAACVQAVAAEARTCWSLPSSHLLGDLRQVGDGWWAAGHGASDGVVDLFLVRGEGDRIHAITPPAAGSAARGAPRLVSDDHRLLGLVWLEGDTQETLEVRAAEWLDGVWGPAVTVSPAGVGSQVAPAVTVLADGRWLLLWTAFDGEDDETLWSLFDGRTWSLPKRLHEDNRNPDVTPAVATTEDGAAAAWSWLDGRDYRLRTAYFDGRRWRLDPALPGRGALQARFVETSGLLLLVFNTVVPAEWVAVEVGPRGDLGRRAAAASDRVEPPRVQVEGALVTFVWDDGELATGVMER